MTSSLKAQKNSFKQIFKRFFSSIAYIHSLFFGCTIFQLLFFFTNPSFSIFSSDAPYNRWVLAISRFFSSQSTKSFIRDSIACRYSFSCVPNLLKLAFQSRLSEFVFRKSDKPLRLLRRKLILKTITDCIYKTRARKTLLETFLLLFN